MGAFRAQLQTTSHNEPISVTWHIALIVIYSRSRIPPPLWDLNLGKLCYLVPVNRPPYPTSLNTHCEDPSMAYLSAIPRHRMYFSTAYHPSTGGQTERVNQILEDMLRSCVISFGKDREKCLPFAEFSCNNSYQSSI